jgi:carboxyl-terminal processing protease
MFNHLNPRTDERRLIIAAAIGLFKRRFYSPTLHGFDIDGLLESQMQLLLETEDFPSAVRALFATTGAHPIDVFYEPERRLPVAKFLKTTLFETPNRECLFRDVLTGGLAEEAGIKSGDRLANLNGEDPYARNCEIHAHRPLQITVEPRSGLSRTLAFPPPSTCKARSNRNVEFRKLADCTGYMRIASWPGILGIDVARETDTAIRALKCKRLVVDLRGNLGSAGAGNLRLMSYLTPDKIPVGFSLTRRRAEDGYDRTQLPRFTQIPRFKVQGFPLLWKFRKVDKSIVVVTEGLKRQAFHGRITLLVNQHTVSGAEIVVQFAKQHGLATIVGEHTAGRSLSFGTLQLPFDFRLTLPIGDYIPWCGHRFEGRGIQPDIVIPYNGPTQETIDPQLERTLLVAA